MHFLRHAIPLAASIAVVAVDCFRAGPLCGQSAETWTLVPQVTIDGENQELTYVTGIGVAPNGEVFIAQPAAYTIKVFSPEGRYLRSIGHRGQGPGEFELLGGIGFVGDTLYANDFVQRRISLFTRDGKLIRTFVIPPLEARSFPNDSAARRYLSMSPSKLVSNNRAYAVPSVSPFDLAERRLTALPLYRVGWDASPQRRLATLAKANEVYVIAKIKPALFRSQPLSDGPIHVVSVSGERFALISGNPSKGIIDIVDISIAGDTIGTRRVPYRPVQITSRIADSVVAAAQEYLDEKKIRISVRPYLYIPKYFKAVSSALMQDDGTIWLQIAAPTEAMRRWLVVSPRSEITGSVALPPTADLISLEGGVWGTQRDSNDVVTVVKYRLDRKASN